MPPKKGKKETKPKAPKVKKDASHSMAAFRLVTFNVNNGTDPWHVLTAISKSGADVVLLQEVTPELQNLAISRCVGAGEDKYAYDYWASCNAGDGMGLLSKFPLEHCESLSWPDDTSHFPTLITSVRLPGCAAAVCVVNVRLKPPIADSMHGEQSPEGIFGYLRLVPKLIKSLDAYLRTSPWVRVAEVRHILAMLNKDWAARPTVDDLLQARVTPTAVNTPSPPTACCRQEALPLQLTHPHHRRPAAGAGAGGCHVPRAGEVSPGRQANQV